MNATSAAENGCAVAPRDAASSGHGQHQVVGAPAVAGSEQRSLRAGGGVDVIERLVHTTLCSRCVRSRGSVWIEVVGDGSPRLRDGERRAGGPRSRTGDLRHEDAHQR